MVVSIVENRTGTNADAVAIVADGYEFDYINGWLHVTKANGILSGTKNKKVFSERISNVESVYLN